MSRYLQESYAKYITEQARRNIFRTNEDIQENDSQDILGEAGRKIDDLKKTISGLEKKHKKIKIGSSDGDKQAHIEAVNDMHAAVTGIKDTKSLGSPAERYLKMKEKQRAKEDQFRGPFN
jgi:hypothetical protein